jgi:outer membrane protein
LRVALGQRGALLLVLLLSGCATSDPLNELGNRSSSPGLAVRPAPERPEESEFSPIPDSGQRPLTRGECVEWALANQPATKVAWLATKVAAAGVGESRSAWLPKVTLHGNAGALGELSGGAGVGAAAQLTLGYLLFDGGERRGHLEAARARLDAADYAHQAVLLDVAVAAEEAFYLLQGANWYRQVVADLVADARHQSELAKARYEVGLVRRYDVAQAQARLAEVELLTTASLAAEKQAAGALARAMGLDPRTPLQIEALPVSDSGLALASVDELMELAIAHRPELGQARARVREALAAHRVAQAGYRPSVSVNASVGATTDSQLGESLPWAAGLGISIPLFSGFETTYAVRRTQFDETKARAELAGLVTDIQFSVWSVHARLQEAAQTFVATGMVVVAAQEAVALAVQSYQSGVGDIGDVLYAQAGLASASLQRVQARLDWLSNLARLHRAIGESLRSSAGGEPEGR